MSFHELFAAFHELFKEVRVDNAMDARSLQPPESSFSAERPDETLMKFADHLRAQGYSARTVEDYAYYARQFVSWLATRGIIVLAVLRPEHLADYQAFVAVRRGPKGDLLAGCTRLGIAVAVAALARFLVKTRRAPRELTDDLTLPRVPRKLPDNVLPMREMERLLAAPHLDDPAELRDRALMELLYATGLRQSEALDLKIGDVDFVADELRVRSGKGGAGRVVPLGQTAASVVSAYLAESRPCLAKGGESGGYLFVPTRGTRLDPSGIHKAFRRYAARAGVTRRVGFHTFRHSVATHLMQRGAGIRYIQELLGHRWLGSTQIYTRVTITDLKRAHARYHPRERMGV